MIDMTNSQGSTTTNPSGSGYNNNSNNLTYQQQLRKRSGSNSSNTTTNTYNNPSNFCAKSGHEANPLNIICIDLCCPNRGVICAHCLLQDHNDHVRSCITLSELTKSLNKAFNNKVIEEIGSSGCDILKKHKQIILGFKSRIALIRKSIDNIESAIEVQMKRLLDEADIYVGDAFEQLLEKLNQPEPDILSLQKDLLKFMPLIDINSDDGELESMTESLRVKEVDRVLQSASILDREAIQQMQKCLDSLVQLSEKLLQMNFETPNRVISTKRFGMVIDSWTLEGINAITFQPVPAYANKEIWLMGCGMYSLIEDTTLGTDGCLFNLCISEGDIAEDKVLLRQEITSEELTSMNHCLHQHRHSEQQQQLPQLSVFIDKITSPLHKKDLIVQVSFEKAIKLNQKDKYTLSLSTTSKVYSHAGMNGSAITSDFQYFDSKFINPGLDNGTNALIGLFPYLVYEIR